ncbi:MAG: radical SAM protein [Elusimicrobiota bacterium]
MRPPTVRIPARRPRLFRAYCVGLPKTGTTSLAALFDDYRSRHDFQHREILERFGDPAAPETSPRAVRSFLRRRDCLGWLEMDSASANFLYVEHLAREFPDGKFLLTVRDCYSWTDSVVGRFLQQFQRPAPDAERRSEMALACRWLGVDAEVFRDERTFLANADGALKAILAFWFRGEGISPRCPPERTLVIRTCDLSRTATQSAIADFIGIDARTLIADRSHRNRNDRKSDVVRKIPRAVLEERFAPYADSPLMKTFFPETSLERFLGATADRPTAACAPAAPRPAEDGLPIAARRPINFWLRGAQAAADRGQQELAFASLSRAGRMNPLTDESCRLAEIYLTLGEPRRAVEALRRIDGAALAAVEARLLKAQSALACGRPALARRSLAQAAALAPGPEFFRRMAWLHVNAGQAARGLKLFEKLTAGGAADAGLWADQANAARAAGRFDLARRSLSRAAGLKFEFSPDILRVKDLEARPGADDSNPGREAVLRVSFACNQNCGFCYIKRSKKVVPLEEIERRLAPSTPNQFAETNLTISGGDPATHPRLADIVASARKKGFRHISLQTNAVGFSAPGLVRKLGPLMYFVSFHSHIPAIYDRLTGSKGQFPLALRGIGNILELADNVLIFNIVVTNLNYAGLPGHVEFVAGLSRPRKTRIFFLMLNDIGLLKAPELAVDLRFVAPSLDKALRRCRERGLEVEPFVGNGAIPLCQTNDPSRYAGVNAHAQDGVRYGDEIDGDDARGRAKRTSCKTCRYDGKCRGVSVAYARRFGLEPLKPIPV